MQRRVFMQTAAAAPLAPTEQPASFESDALERMAVGRVPGAVVGVIENGKPGWVRPLGVLSVESKKPVTASSVFQSASLTKQVLAQAAHALRAQGKLDFERTLVSYVDDLRDPRARKVTIRHVLSHSSGFPNWRSEEGQELAPAFEPGTQFQYSGEGYFYLQRILESVSGKGIGMLIEELVFQPLGMTSSSMMWRPEWLEQTALPHTRTGELRKNWDKAPRVLSEFAAKKGQSVKTWKYQDYAAAAKELGSPALPNYLLPNGAASMVTSASDYAKFVAAAMKNPELRKEQISMGPGVGWGLGWGVERLGKREFLWQWGDNGGYKNIVMAEPTKGEAIFVFTNSDGGGKFYEWIVRNVTGVDHPAFLRI